MSEVKRYYVHWNDQRYVADPKNGNLVMVEDFDRVTAERDAALGRETALREELGKQIARCNDFSSKLTGTQQRLTAADERVDVLTKALTDVREALGREYWDQYAGLDETRDILDAALKPAEGGGDDLDEHDRSSQAYWDDQAAQGKPYEQQLREACERNGIDLMLDTD